MGTMLASGEFPKCPTCGNNARPALLMFMDWQWTEPVDECDIGDNWDVMCDRVLKTNPDANFVCVEIGAGNRVPSIRMKSEARVAEKNNSTLIRINPDPSCTDSVGRAVGRES